MVLIVMTSITDNPADGPFVRKYRLELSPPSDNDHIADLERVLRGLEGHGLFNVQAPLSIIAGISDILRASGFKVSVTVGFGPTPTILRVEPAASASRNLGLAIDLGSTNIVGMIIDLDTGEGLGEQSEVNPQVAHGEDILSRTHFCIGNGHLQRLHAQASGCISSIAAKLTEKSGLTPADISCVSVAGNTTMAHLFLGLDPYHICRTPYVPVANRFPVIRARDLGLGVNPEALVYVLPNVGSYVGGDALAGVLVCGMHERDEYSLMVDVGTNAEIVVGNREFLLVGAGSAGPGLEGGVVLHGMRAMPGAIERIIIDPATLEPTYTVIDGIKPSGMCGFALIDLMSELFTTGIIDGKGRFVQPHKTWRVREHEGRHCYVVATESESATGNDIVFTEPDIENLMMSKAAMYTMLNIVTSSVGIGFGDLADFYIAGAFGSYIAADKAVTIGMVPDIELSRYKLLGNSSLRGAAQTLLSRSKMDEVERIARLMTYMEMNVSNEFMNEYMAAMFLPHTDSSLFPSVQKRGLA